MKVSRYKSIESAVEVERQAARVIAHCLLTANRRYAGGTIERQVLVDGVIHSLVFGCSTHEGEVTSVEYLYCEMIEGDPS